MVILAVNGRTYAEGHTDFVIEEPIRRATLLASTGEILDIEIPPDSPSQGRENLSMWTLGSVFALLGAAVVLRRPDLYVARMFWLFAGMTALALAVGPSSGAGLAWARILQGPTFVAVGVFILPFAFTFAADHVTSKQAFAIPLHASLGVIIIASYGVSLFARPSIYDVVRPAMFLYVVTSVVGALGLLAAKAVRQRMLAGREQARIVLWGTALGTLPLVSLTLIPEALGYGSLLPVALTVLALGLIPASFAYAILQHQLLGIRRLIHRGMVYGTATFALLLAIAIFLTLVPFWRAEVRGANAALVSSTLVGGVLLFLLLRRGARWMVDRFIYRDVFGYSTFLETLRKDLPTPKHTSEVADLVAGHLVRLLRLESAFVFLGHSPSQSSVKVAAGPRCEALLRLVRPQAESLLEASETQEMIEMRWQSNSLLVAPLYPAGEYLGYLLLGPKEDGEIFTDEEKRLVTITADMLALSIAKSELSEELRELNRKLVKAEESERARMAADLHDGPLQKAILLAGSALARDDGQATLARQLVFELREIGARLRPAILDDLGLVPALEWLLETVSKQFGVRTRLSIEDIAEEERFPPEIELALFRVAQEAANNAVKHAKGTSLEVSLSREPSALILKVADDGVGFVPQAGRMSGFGLAGMRERILQVDGSFEIRSAPGSGTMVVGRIPLKDDREAQ